MPILVNIVDYKLGERHVFGEDPITIGRLSKNDIPIKNKQVSRQHAKIVADTPGEYVLEDMNSTNYVYVNRKQSTRASLQHGDLINVGGVADFLFLLEEDPDLAEQILENLRQDPEYSPANFALKKTMASLVDELSQSQINTGLRADTSTLEDIEHLYEIAYSINSTLDLNEVLTMIVRKVLAITNGERGFVMLKPLDNEIAPGGETPPLEVKIARTEDEDLSGVDRSSFSQSIVQKALETGETYVSTNAAEDPVMNTASVINYAIREVMCAPLRVRDDIIGTLYVDTRQAKGSFAKRDILFFEAISHQAAIALANARMTEDLKGKQLQLEKAYSDLLDRSKRLQQAKGLVEQKVKELSALNSVASGINMASGDLDSLLRLIVDKTAEVLNAAWGSLMLVTDDEATLNEQMTSGDGGRRVPSLSLVEGEDLFKKALEEETVQMAVRGSAEFQEQVPRGLDVDILMVVPLILNRRKIGVVAVADPTHKRAFLPEEQALASTLASQAAVTIENARLYNLAIYDGLTKLHDRRYFDIWLQKEFERTRRYRAKLSLVMLDIDHFKSINDDYGHQCGDAVLKTFSSIIRDSIRSVDLGARYGGEEFAVILPETDEEGAMLFAERLRARVEQTPIRWDASMFPITVSAGVATCDPEFDQTRDDFISRADQALYASKATGRNKVTNASTLERKGVASSRARTGEAPEAAGGGPSPPPEEERRGAADPPEGGDSDPSPAEAPSAG